MSGFAALAARDTADWAQRRLLAMSTTVYAQCLLARPQGTDSALAAERSALEIYAALARRRADDLDLELRVADAHSHLARTYSLRLERADSALAHVEISQRLVEAIAASDPANRDRAVDVATGLASEGHLLAAGGESDRAERALSRAQVLLKRWRREDPTDARMVGSLPDVYLGFGLAAIHRALQTAPGARRIEAWRAAREWRARACATFDHDLGISGPWELSHEESERIDHAGARCDSALAGGTPEPRGH